MATMGIKGLKLVYREQLYTVSDVLTILNVDDIHIHSWAGCCWLVSLVLWCCRFIPLPAGIISLHSLCSTWFSTSIDTRYDRDQLVPLASLFSMFPEGKPNSADVPSPLQLHKSGTKYLLPLELHHHSTVSNTTLKPVISPFREIPIHLVTACTSDLSLLYSGALTNLLHYITVPWHHFQRQAWPLLTNNPSSQRWLRQGILSIVVGLIGWLNCVFLSWNNSKTVICLKHHQLMMLKTWNIEGQPETVLDCLMFIVVMHK